MKASSRVQTCGKLYLAGEYAVLTAGQPAIIKDIPIYMTGEIQTSPGYHLTSDMFEQLFIDLTAFLAAASHGIDVKRKLPVTTSKVSR